MPNISIDSKSILKEVLQSPGFSSKLSLAPGELDLLQTEINKQWLAAICNQYPNLAEHAKELGVERYHELPQLIDHNSLWNKRNRCLPQSVVETIKKQNFYSRLIDIFGPFEISEMVYDNNHVPGREEIYWRIVRPNVVTDVGSLHADKWFHEILGLKGRALRKGAYTIKIWIPIYSEPGKNGLMVVPNSHVREWKHSMNMINGISKPTFLDKAEPELIATPPGNMLIFNEDTLHGGAINCGTTTRVSVEITMVFEKKPIY